MFHNVNKPLILGQYVRVGRTLPHILLFDLMAISDKYGAEIKKRLEAHKAHGTWGDSKYIYGKYNQLFTNLFFKLTILSA